MHGFDDGGEKRQRDVPDAEVKKLRVRVFGAEKLLLSAHLRKEVAARQLGEINIDGGAERRRHGRILHRLSLLCEPLYEALRAAFKLSRRFASFFAAAVLLWPAGPTGRDQTNELRMSLATSTIFEEVSMLMRWMN